MAKFVYVDNSNVWIAGRRVAAVESKQAFDIIDAFQQDVFDLDWKYDFGKLLTLVGGERNGLKRAVLFGSRPPQNDSLWQAARESGFEVFVHDRNQHSQHCQYGREKKIDTGIVTEMMADSYERIQNKDEDELVLIAGDSDYVPLIKKVRLREIRVIVWFWEHASRELKEVATEFHSLNPYVEQIRR